MTDLEQGLRELFETKAGDASFPPRPEPKVLRRARRRQLRTVLVAVMGVVAIIAGSIAGILALDRAGTRPKPAEGEAKTRSVVLPYASISYPEDWYLLDLNGTSDGELSLQLTNFDPVLAAMECGTGSALPARGVLLSIRAAAVEWAGTPTPWPVELDPRDGSCPGELDAEWSEDGLDFVAQAASSPDAAEADRNSLLDAFASLDVAPPEEPLTEALRGAPALVLDTKQSPLGPAVLYVYEDDCCVSSAGGPIWLGIAGPAGSGLEGGPQMARQVPGSDEAIGLSYYEWGALVSGDLAATVTRADIHAETAGVYEGTLIELPHSLGMDGHLAVWGFVEQPTQNVVVAIYDERGELIPGVPFPVGDRVTIAAGQWDGGEWSVFVEPSNQGLAYGFDSNGPEGGFGGSYGCCLEPLRGVLRVFNAGTFGPDQSVIMAFVSDDVVRVVYEAEYDGSTTAATPVLVSDASLGVPKVVVLFPPAPPKRGSGMGQLVAYDERGNELWRERYGLPPGG